MDETVVKTFLCGDVMLGRGIDQLQPTPGDPTLRERHVTDATTYVGLAERVNGPIPRPVDPTWPWGDALAVLDEEAPELRVVNLETSITRSDDFAEGKQVHYRMNPANIGCLMVVSPDVCALANNHVLDFGGEGLKETLEVLDNAGLATAGAGRDAREARRPAVTMAGAGHRILTFSIGMVSSGIPSTWAATAQRGGVTVLEESSPADVRAAVELIEAWKRPGDLVIVSVHWGSNWGYEVHPDQTRLAHALIDAGVDVVHGHSSHHPRPLEVYRNRLILYGCGDLVDDYEGITGHERFRGELRLLYLADIEARTGGLRQLRMIPLRQRRMRLQLATSDEAAWLRSVLDPTSRDRGAAVVLGRDGTLTLQAV